MSRTIGPGSPPTGTRFRKGQSGNPKGRPKAGKPKASSAFDIVIDRTLPVTQGGRPREMTVEEALQHRTYEDAVAGSRPARREVLKMIAKRERYLAAREAGKAPQVERRILIDPDNANAAMSILGMTCRCPGEQSAEVARGQLLLEPWAVQAALSRRRGGQRLTSKEVADIQRSTRDSKMLRWPRRTVE